MGREVLQVPEVLIVSQPTWGVDAGAAAAIHQALVDLAARGSAIVVISQDLDELLALSDSLAVINEGRLSPKRAVGDVSIEEIGMLMGGVHGEADHGRMSRHRGGRRPMLFELEKRKEPSRAMVYLTPVIAVLLTMVVGAVVFSLLGYDGPARSGRSSSSRSSTRGGWQDLGVKAAPLIMIAIGLSIGFRANVWNIGAEGQYIIGGLAGTGVALATWHLRRWWILPLMCVAGAVGGHGLCRDPGVPAHPDERQRDPVEPDADLRLGPAALLPDERAVEGSGGLQLPAVAAVQRARSCPTSADRLPERAARAPDRARRLVRDGARPSSASRSASSARRRRRRATAASAATARSG